MDGDGNGPQKKKTEKIAGPASAEKKPASIKKGLVFILSSPIVQHWQPACQLRDSITPRTRCCLRYEKVRKA
jgi:hypothetical protein